MKKRPDKPNVFNYRQTQVYLAALLKWYKQKGLSLRTMAARLEVSPALLSLIVNGKRSLTEENVDLWAPTLGWDSQEASWLKQIILLENSPVDKKQQAIEHLSRFHAYQEGASQEVLTFRYLKKWWNVAIREMSALPDFIEEATWIQDRLRFRVSLHEIRKSLDFLNKHKLLAKYGDFRHLDCQGDVYRVSLSTFHEQLLKKAVESIYQVPSEERHIMGQTLPLRPSQFPEARKILDEALTRIMSLYSAETGPGDVYHFSFLGFPLTEKKDTL